MWTDAEVATGDDESRARELEHVAEVQPSAPSRKQRIQQILTAGDALEVAAAARREAAQLRDDAAEGRDAAAAQREESGDFTGVEEHRHAAAADRVAAALDRVWEGRDADAAAEQRAELAEIAREGRC